jgi:hypothetical protein
MRGVSAPKRSKDSTSREPIEIDQTRIVLYLNRPNGRLGGGSNPVKHVCDLATFFELPPRGVAKWRCEIKWPHNRGQEKVGCQEVRAAFFIEVSSCFVVESLIAFHFWNLELSSAEKAGIQPTYQAPFQEVVTSPLPTPLGAELFFSSNAFSVIDASRSPHIPSQSGGH